MPVYEYRCERGHLFDAIQRMSDEPLASCTACEAPVQRVFRPPAVHFKGSGFYTTDYGRAGGGEKGATEGSSSSSEASKDGGKEDKSGSGDSKGAPSSSASTPAAAASE